MVIPFATAFADEWPTTRFTRHEHDPTGTAADHLLAEWNASATRRLSWGPHPGVAELTDWSVVRLGAVAGGAASREVVADQWWLDVWVFLEVAVGADPRAVSGWVPATLVVDPDDVGRGVLWTRGDADFVMVEVSEAERSRLARVGPLELSVRFVADADGHGYLHVAVGSESWRGIVAAELVAAPPDPAPPGPGRTTRRRARRTPR